MHPTDSRWTMTTAEQESIAAVRRVLDEQADDCPDLADLWRGWSEDLRTLAAGEPLPDLD